MTTKTLFADIGQQLATRMADIKLTDGQAKALQAAVDNFAAAERQLLQVVAGLVNNELAPTLTDARALVEKLMAPPPLDAEAPQMQRLTTKRAKSNG